MHNCCDCYVAHRSGMSQATSFCTSVWVTCFYCTWAAKAVKSSAKVVKTISLLLVSKTVMLQICVCCTDIHHIVSHLGLQHCDSYGSAVGKSALRMDLNSRTKGAAKASHRCAATALQFVLGHRWRRMCSTDCRKITDRCKT